jgi:biopolymer transport protein ExbB/TolQ
LAAAPGWFESLLGSSLLWGTALTVAVYEAVPYLPVYRDTAERYLCAHWTEYAIIWTFCLGAAALLLRAARLRSERAALAANVLPAETSSDLAAARQRLARALDFLPGRWRRTHVGRRLGDVCEYLHSRPNADGLEDHLKYLADQSAVRVHESYGFVRTITWAVPILGFLGTVIGITMAIANVTPEQLDTSLSSVTDGLAVAFDTTALALALSMVLVFGCFVVERAEHAVLSRVEDFGVRRLAVLCPTSGSEVGGTLVDAEHQAARQLVERTESLVTWQTQVWQESLEALRSRWTDTLRQQQDRMGATLTAGMASTLGDHDATLRQFRGEFLEAFRGVAVELRESVADLRDSQTELARRCEQTVDALRGDLAQQVAELGRQKDVLLEVVAQEAELTRLQDRLNENLHALRASEALEETLHSLSAAVHLLTARAKPRDEQSRAA